MPDTGPEDDQSVGLGHRPDRIFLSCSCLFININTFLFIRKLLQCTLDFAKLSIYLVFSIQEFQSPCYMLLVKYRATTTISAIFLISSSLIALSGSRRPNLSLRMSVPAADSARLFCTYTCPSPTLFTSMSPFSVSFSLPPPS